MATSDYAGCAPALLEDAGIDPEYDDERLRPGYVPRVVRLCLACGERGQAKGCPRCGGSTLVEDLE